MVEPKQSAKAEMVERYEAANIGNAVVKRNICTSIYFEKPGSAT